MLIKKQLEQQMQQFLAYITNKRVGVDKIPADLLQVLQRKRSLFQKRDAEIVKATADVSFIRQLNSKQYQEVDYQVHLKYLVHHHELFYMEEEQLERRVYLKDGRIVEDKDIAVKEEKVQGETLEREITKGKYDSYQYNRLEAVKYAERWWDDRNPAYRNFPDNCTNFISQCLHIGETPMTGYPNIRKGWWQRENQWSWSWAVAHSFYWYLSGATTGLRAKAVENPEDLLLGDVIVYDFEDDGRWNHTTIVVAKDADGMPLVNAHSANSRRRYWNYEDSSKYTPQMKYKFFHIING
ncbi:putative amidase domain protein [Bacillus pseudomycoides]|uniref:amidase domain-containing protein n=1 Tax=Bacillus TaxID=1386 RepID=UPI00035F0757|nr:MULTISPECIES: amidase domain-containing protein [Bacillus]AIK40641.1 putative amidase domain protein [Bacillus pseudomycoides]AJI18433.1 putative amidase domain protein [Bacillus pseudomycoides]MEB3055662.1 amidase domain-containing protein [Bacillus pseudomycoides]